ncbi:hypothetical protein BSKO_01074 [Bryopsis sp. KO-2023]|nr:hypothetical protein BSKO_01074 [Bryopsis sp. KO-2023]
MGTLGPRGVGGSGGVARALCLRWCVSFVNERERSRDLGRVVRGLGFSFWAFGCGLLLSFLLCSYVGLARFLCYLAFAELVFVLINAFRFSMLDRVRNPPSQDDAKLSFDRFIKSVSKLDRSYVTTCTEDWFFGRPCEDLQRGDFDDLMSYGFLDDCRSEGHAREAAETMTGELMRVMGLSLQPGRTRPAARFRAHLAEKLRAYHYPLVFYIVSETLGIISHVMLLCMGFAKSSCRGSAYFLHKPSKLDSPASQRPIVFLHGVGVGILPYMSFIRRILALGHPVLLVENRHVCMRLSFPHVSVDDCVDTLKTILDGHHLTNCMVMSHSYGTFVASRLLRLYPTFIDSMCFIDPVCCAMHNPKLLKNFVYRRMEWGGLRAIIESLVMLCVSREPSISASVSRGFQWTALNLWPELLPQRSVIVLSENDDLVPIGDVKTLFANTGATILSHPQHQHGSFVVDGNWQDTILRQVARVLRG